LAFDEQNDLLIGIWDETTGVDELKPLILAL
jgi:hypothetical protein